MTAASTASEATSSLTFYAVVILQQHILHQNQMRTKLKNKCTQSDVQYLIDDSN